MRTAGLTDLQVNGHAGVDFNDALLTADALDHALEAMLRTNVTTCLPTLITADEATLGARFAALDSAVAGSRLGPKMVPGYHLEGPFLNPAAGYAGCHPAAAMILPDPAVLDRLTRNLRRPVLLLTLAPERAGALPLIRWARSSGMVVALGHTAADHATIAEAARAGATLSTHLGNALPQPQPKFLNPLMAQLAADDLHASFIADGIHIPPAALKVMLRAKTPDRCILITDATAGAAAPPGIYCFAGMTIERKPDGSVRIAGSAAHGRSGLAGSGLAGSGLAGSGLAGSGLAGSGLAGSGLAGSGLAGSGLCLDQAVRNLVAWHLADAAGALDMASAHPNALLGPALKHHGVALTEARVIWSADLRPIGPPEFSSL